MMQKDILETLYRDNYRAAYIYTLSLCKNIHLAEDIVNDAFVKAYLSFPEKNTHFKYWLFVVCRNQFFDMTRRKTKRAEENIYNYENALQNNSSENIIFTKERNQLLYSSILQLPEKYKEILILHYFSGLSLSDISRILNLSPSNTKTILHRARIKLKSILEGSGYEF